VQLISEQLGEMTTLAEALRINRINQLINRFI
jgi:hypothetical protein